MIAVFNIHQMLDGTMILWIDLVIELNNSLRPPNDSHSAIVSNNLPWFCQKFGLAIMIMHDHGKSTMFFHEYWQGFLYLVNIWQGC